MTRPTHLILHEQDPRPVDTTAPGPHPVQPPPLSLYVHYPWCVKKCPYCDFNSHTQRAGTDPAALESAYIDALIADLAAAAATLESKRVDTVFFGGGTPSLMSAAALTRLMQAIDCHLDLAPDAEITLEANPGTFEAERFRAYRAAGINRLSIGVQSFNDNQLQRLGRIHSGDEACRAIEIATTHFERVNLDLMYALPAQTVTEAMQDLERAIAFGTEHLSCYHLTLEPNTAFYRQPPPLPDDDSAADMQEGIEARLGAAGFEHYETSAFARAGAQCRHNLNYWQYGDYLGIGAGAHGKLSTGTAIVREMRHKHPQRYLENAASGRFVQQRHSVPADELPFEFMMNALRLSDGVPAELFQARTGLPPETISPQLQSARAQGLLEAEETMHKPSAHGRRFLNDLLTLFLDV